MTLTENEPITPPADTLGGAGPGRRPIDDVGAYLDSLPHDARLGLRTLGELLVGVTQQAPRAETADRFTARALSVTNAAQLIDEERELDPVSRLTTALALAEWITSHTNVIEVGPGEYALYPAWTQTEIGGRTAVCGMTPPTSHVFIVTFSLIRATSRRGTDRSRRTVASRRA